MTSVLHRRVLSDCSCKFSGNVGNGTTTMSEHRQRMLNEDDTHGRSV
jgi:hypothetical protein